MSFSAAAPDDYDRVRSSLWKGIVSFFETAVTDHDDPGTAKEKILANAVPRASSRSHLLTLATCIYGVLTQIDGFLPFGGIAA